MIDIAFLRFDWPIQLDGDFALIDGLDALRDLIVRWLLTEPREDAAGLTDEEIERRRAYPTSEARAEAYDAPDGDRLGACLPWDPTWGAGIKKFLNAPETAATVAEVRTRIRLGLPTLEGVKRVEYFEVSMTRDQLTVQWRIEAATGDSIEDTTIVRL